MRRAGFTAALITLFALALPLPASAATGDLVFQVGGQHKRYPSPPAGCYVGLSSPHGFVNVSNETDSRVSLFKSEDCSGAATDIVESKHSKLLVSPTQSVYVHQ